MRENVVISLVLALKQWFCIALTHVQGWPAMKFRQKFGMIWQTAAATYVRQPNNRNDSDDVLFAHSRTLAVIHFQSSLWDLHTPNFMYPRSMSYSVALQRIYKIKIIACCPPNMYVTLLPIRPCRPKCLLFLSSPLAIDRLTVLCCLFCWLSPYLIDVFYSPHVSQARNHIKWPIIYKTVNIWNLLLKEVKKVLILYI